MTLFPKISIIISVRNMRAHLSKAIESVLSQEYNNFELIVMDGKSTDGTVEIIKYYEKYISYWESKEDKGCPDACNQALDKVSGEWIGFLNADDYYKPGLFHKILDNLQQNPAAKMISCGLQVVEKDASGRENILQTLIEPTKLQMTLYNILFVSTAFNARFFHKDIFKYFGKFQAIDVQGRMNLANDCEFLVRLVLKAIRTEIIPEALYVYLSHEGSFTFSKKNLERIHLEHLNIAEKLLRHPLSSDELKLIKTWQTREFIYLFLTLIKGRQFFRALQAGIQGIAKNPMRWTSEFAAYIYRRLFRIHP